jgi:hypothetical protein
MANAHVSRASRWGVRRRALAGATLTALCTGGLLGGLSACGSSSTSSTASASAASSTSSTSTPSATTTTMTGPTEAQKAADQATARDSTLKVSDFPSGWVESDKSSSSGSTCPSVEPAKNSASGKAKTPTFGKGETDAVENSVYIYATVAEAQRVFPGLSGSETRACIAHNTEKEVNKNATGSAKFGQATSGQLSAPPLGDESAAGRVTVPYTNAGLSFSLNIDLQFVRVSRGVQVLTFLTLPGTFDSTLEAKLTRTAANRLKAELAKSP